MSLPLESASAFNVSVPLVIGVVVLLLLVVALVAAVRKQRRNSD